MTEHENELYVISYYLNNYECVSNFNYELFQDNVLRNIAICLQEMRELNLQFDDNTLRLLLSKKNIDIPQEKILEIKTKYKNDYLNIEYHIKQLKSNYNKKVVSKNLIETLLNKVNGNEYLTSESIIRVLDNIRRRLIDDESSYFCTSEDLVSRYYKELDERAKKYKKRTSGFSVLDEKLSRPGAPKEIRIIAALRGSGKSIFAQTTVNRLLDRGIPCVYFSIEMSEESIVDRYVTSYTGIPIKKLNSDSERYSNDNKVMDSLNNLANKKNFLFSDRSDWDFDKIDVALYEAKEHFRKNEIFKEDEYMVCVFDVLNMILDFGDQSPMTILLAMDKFHRLVKKHEVHAIGIVQLNENKLRSRNFREPSELDSFRPNLEDIYGASAYAQRAREVAILHRPKFLKERLFPHLIEHFGYEPDILEYHCVKQNDGPLFFEKFDFDGSRMTIYPIVDKEDLIKLAKGNESIIKEEEEIF